MKTYGQLHHTVITTNTAELIAHTETGRTGSTPKSISVYFLMNFTINPIEPILKFYLHESNMLPTIRFGSFDTVMQEVLDDDSSLYQQKYDIIVCALLHDPLDTAFLKKLVNPSLFISELKSLFELIQTKTGALLLINTIIPPFFAEFGISTSAKHSRAQNIGEINRFIYDFVKQSKGQCLLMDWARYSQILGEQNSIDARYWYMYKAPFKKAFLSYYAADITRVARALHAYSKKCLILDCDNTLWGGIIGEDGISGIKLDNHDSPGKIFYDFQSTVLELVERGVILALCSKNNEADVWEVIENHPHCLLRREHIAAHRINWQDKSNNIIDLVNELNIGIDACVFIDDSPTECELIRLAIPQLTVIQVPQQLYEYPTLLFKEGLFDTLIINAEDVKRNQKYQQESQRKEAQKHARNMTEYLTSLQLVATIQLLQPNNVPRVAQLTQKTNQFNLSTRRYTQQQIELLNCKDSAIFTLTVSDKFGDYGLTGVLIIKRKGKRGHIDSFLMSCRILSRHLEFVFLEECLNYLRARWRIDNWEAEYIPTEKNGQIQDFLAKAGFTKITGTNYTLDTENWCGFRVNHIKALLEGFEHG